MKNNKQQLIFGKNAVMEIIKSGQNISKVFVQPTEANKEIIRLCNQYDIPFSKVPKEKLNKITGKNHQGIIAYISPIPYHDLNNIIQSSYEKGKDPKVIILDGITDIRNFGGIVRTALCFDFCAVIIEKQNSPLITEDAMKSSAGALSYMPICRVPNLSLAIDTLIKSGLAIYAFTEKGEKNIYDTDFKKPLALILGSEDKGIKPKHLEIANEILKIPLTGQIGSLNVSVAMAIGCYENYRQNIL